MNLCNFHADASNLVDFRKCRPHGVARQKVRRSPRSVYPWGIMNGNPFAVGTLQSGPHWTERHTLPSLRQCHQHGQRYICVISIYGLCSFYHL